MENVEKEVVIDAPLPKAIIVSGPVSAGNRLFAGMCVRGGCSGEGSTRQIKSVFDIPDPENDYVTIQHNNASIWIEAFRKRGYEVRAVIMVREGLARDLSAFKRGHEKPSFTREARLRTIQRNMRDYLDADVPFEFAHYEALGIPAVLKNLMKFLGLRTDNIDQPLYLPGQEVKCEEFENQNFKYYESGEVSPTLEELNSASDS